MIDQGVRQIAILADDFWNPGGPNGVRLLNDMTAWLEEVKKQYPDMKMTIPYVPYDYMGNGSSAELQELKKAPANVQIVMTGGRVWGEVTNNLLLRLQITLDADRLCGSTGRVRITLRNI